MLKIFYSYSHIDETYREQLEKHLSILKRNKIIDGWHDRKITPGEEWNPEIDTNLQSANIILLLISSDFIDSNYCYDIEMQKAMELHNAGRAAVVPIIIRPCLWTDTPFAKLQALPKDGKPVSKWSNLDDAWLSVAEGLKRLCDKLQPKTVVSQNTVQPIAQKSFTIITTLGLQLTEKINLLNNDIHSFSKKSCLNLTGIRDFDRVYHWPNVVIYGNSEITEEGIRYKGGANPYSNQEYKYILNVNKNGSIIYEEEFVWDKIDELVFNTEEFIEKLFFFITYSSSWSKKIQIQSSLDGMKEINLSLRIPKSSYLGAPIDLVNSGFTAPRKISDKEIKSAITIKSLEYLHRSDVMRVCAEFLNVIISEFSYQIGGQVHFPVLDEEVLEQRLNHLSKLIKK